MGVMSEVVPVQAHNHVSSRTRVTLSAAAWGIKLIWDHQDVVGGKKVGITREGIRCKMHFLKNVAEGDSRHRYAKSLLHRRTVKNVDVHIYHVVADKKELVFIIPSKLLWKKYFKGNRRIKWPIQLPIVEKRNAGGKGPARFDFREYLDRWDLLESP